MTPSRQPDAPGISLQRTTKETHVQNSNPPCTKQRPLNPKPKALTEAYALKAAPPLVAVLNSVAGRVEVALLPEPPQDSSVSFSVWDSFEFLIPLCLEIVATRPPPRKFIVVGTIRNPTSEAKTAEGPKLQFHCMFRVALKPSKRPLRFCMHSCAGISNIILISVAGYYKEKSGFCFEGRPMLVWNGLGA